jgi:hypothetical protein
MTSNNAAAGLFDKGEFVYNTAGANRYCGH